MRDRFSSKAEFGVCKFDGGLHYVRRYEARQDRLVLFFFILIVFIGVLVSLVLYKSSVFQSQVTIKHEYRMTEEYNAYWVLLNTGDHYLQRGDFDRALSEYSLAARIFPESAYHEAHLAAYFYARCIEHSTACDIAIRWEAHYIEECSDESYLQRVINKI